MNPRVCLSLAWFLAACAAGEGDTQVSQGGPTGSRGVTQACAQDIAHFREQAAEGKMPASSSLDEVGFFAEHALDQPPATCGDRLCSHPMLAVAPRFDAGTWTMAFVSLNTPVDPETQAREPVHVVVALESSVAADPTVSDALVSLGMLRDALRPEDRLSVLAFGETAISLAHGLEVGDTTLGVPHLPEIEGEGVAVDLYAGIARAAELRALEGFSGVSRIVLVTSGTHNRGITDPERILHLAESVVRDGTPFSVIGVGDEYAAELPSRIANLGSGGLAYARHLPELGDLMAQEAELRLVPLATDVELRIVPSEGYSVGRIYGARSAVVEDGAAVLRTPALMLGARESANDVADGRRGGGGGFFVELVTDSQPSGNAGEGAFRLETSYFDVVSATVVTRSAEVVNSLRVGERPPDQWPSFSEPEFGKAFMMLNMFLALRATVTLYEGGDCEAATGVALMMEPGIELWQERFDDPDIAADAALLSLLAFNVREQCGRVGIPRPPVEFDGGCFGI
jgi:Ca-activated chloride channel family protein